MESQPSDDDIFHESPPANKQQRMFPGSPRSSSMRRNNDEPVNALVRQMKSGSISTQENGESERPAANRRRMSVLDEKALREDDTKLVREQRINAISRSYQVILESVGEDPSRQGERMSTSIHPYVHCIFPHRSAQDTETSGWSRWYREEWDRHVGLSCRLWSSSPKATNNRSERWSAMLSSMKTARIWWWWKKSIFILSVNITCRLDKKKKLDDLYPFTLFIQGSFLWQSIGGLFAKQACLRFE